jgi:putative membrane protein
MMWNVASAAAAGLLALAPATAVQAFGDAEVAHVAYTAGVIDIAAGKQALARSKNQAVRTFAEEMVRDHGAVNEQALALVARLHVKPSDNPTSAALNEAAAQASRKLSSLHGSSFDRAYVANEVSFHRKVNGALRTSLIPSARNAELKALLQTGLHLFSEHQMHAEELATKLR